MLVLAEGVAGFLIVGRASDLALCSCPSHLQTHKLFLVTCDTFPLGRLQSELKIGNQSVHSLYRYNYVNYNILCAMQKS